MKQKRSKAERRSEGMMILQDLMNPRVIGGVVLNTQGLAMSYTPKGVKH